MAALQEARRGGSVSRIKHAGAGAEWDGYRSESRGPHTFCRCKLSKVIVSSSLSPSSRGGVAAFASASPAADLTSGEFTYFARTSWAFVLGAVEDSCFFKSGTGVRCTEKSEVLWRWKQRFAVSVSVFGGCLWFLAWAPGFPALDDPQQGGAMFFYAAATSRVTH